MGGQSGKQRRFGTEDKLHRSVRIIIRKIITISIHVDQSFPQYSLEAKAQKPISTAYHHSVWFKSPRVRLIFCKKENKRVNEIFTGNDG